jgi:3-phosphoshikimate 1-carboxyvinyltransferase
MNKKLSIFIAGFIIYGILGYLIGCFFSDDQNPLFFAVVWGVLMGLAEVNVLEPFRIRRQKIKKNTSMQLKVNHIQSDIHVSISGSKSETNRLLLLKAQFPSISIENKSSSDDSEVMMQALQKPQPVTRNSQLIDVHHAGTAMRFLTAFFAIQEDRVVVLTGSSRMKERPIKILVEALRTLGADIEYLENEGFPPLKITGKKLQYHTVSVDAGVSSQYLSALLLIAPSLPQGLTLNLMGTLTSRPYLEMTLSLLQEVGVTTTFNQNVIVVHPLKTPPEKTLFVESDWSSASYFYSIIALSQPGTTLTLKTFKSESLQGDRRLVDIYQSLGISTTFHDSNAITLIKTEAPIHSAFHWDLVDCPDIAQTIAVTCFGLGVRCHLTGLHTLKIKETDRLEALKNELSKCGANITITNDSLLLQEGSPPSKGPNQPIKTYQDHRMAMAFAPLAISFPVAINNPEVVSKSYPDFWEDIQKLGFEIS